eukprot:TRINITY_DN84673_c0_g1_i1.p2 TRINITY_DN84673_c0_g1~~TRINITY_DN84673_c0_g1_i1.p2  ORF type:complete len:118 (+),score=35.77 TRINITY_DN84673_c0_g1_i1:73-426(+)
MPPLSSDEPRGVWRRPTYFNAEDDGMNLVRSAILDSFHEQREEFRAALPGRRAGVRGGLAQVRREEAVHVPLLENARRAAAEMRQQEEPDQAEAAAEAPALASEEEPNHSEATKDLQ